MKTFRKLIPALGMLLISAIMLTTASFAWFAMQNNVEATGMQVTVKSDSVFLLIGAKSDTIATIQSSNKSSATGTAPDTGTEMYPSAWNKPSSGAVTDATGQALGFNDVSGTSGVGTKFATATNWYTAEAGSVSATAAAEKAGVALTSDNFGNYVVQYEFNLTLAKGSNPVAANKILVRYDPTITNGKSGSSETADAVKVIVVCGDNYEEFSGTTAKDGTVKLNAEQITDSALTNVKVYVYYDGNHSSVYTNNVENLEGATFKLNFSIDDTASN